ncbi:uncharacterized protein FFE2_15112 [Fusarium fujikuroi]|nr:uncharacterized protein FFE2_15112 [Fusarium fujikuroi]
MRRLRENAYI